MKEQNTSNFNQALWLFISQFGTLVLAFVSAAILSRYLDKSEYGTYKQIMYVYTTLHTVFVVGLPSIFSYFIPRLSNGQGKTLVKRFTFILGLLGASFSSVLYFGSTVIAQILNNPELASGLKIFALVPLFTLPTIGVDGIYTALRKTKQVAYYQVSGKLFHLICVVAPVLFFGGSYRAALIGWTIASFFIFIMALWMVNRPYVKIKAEHIPDMYKMVFSYSVPLMGAGIVGMLLFAANQFYVSRYYGNVVFAEFSNGYIPLPFLSIIITPVKNVLLPLFSKASFEGNMQEIHLTYKNAISKVINIVLPVLLFCLFFAKDIMILLYGSQYAVSKTYFRISLCKDVFDIFPYLVILLAFGKSNIYFYVYSIAAVLTWGVDAVVVYNHLHPACIAVVSSAIHIIIVGFMFVYLKRALKFKMFELVKKHFLTVVIHVLPLLCIVYLMRTSCLKDLGCLPSLSICGVVFYLLLAGTGKALKINYLESIAHFHVKQ